MLITPINVFFAFMFRKINTFRSFTIVRLEALRALHKSKRRKEKLYKGTRGQSKLNPIVSFRHPFPTDSLCRQCYTGITA
jgi:hypothetical protein